MRGFVALAPPMVALAAAVGGGWYWWTEAQYVETTDNAYIESDIAAVSPKIEGYVAEILVDDNQAVQAGQVLAVIDDFDFAARVDRAYAAVEAQRAAVDGMGNQIAFQTSLVAQASATIASAEAKLARARQDFARAELLLEKDFVSKQKYDAAHAELREAAANVKRAKAEADAQQQKVGVFAAKRSELSARLAEAEAALELAEHDLDHTVIRAPIDGVVGSKGVRIGQYVRPGTQLLLLVPVDEIYVVANFKETQISGMRTGQQVDLTFDAFPDYTIEGRIESFSPASGSEFSLLPPENATGNFTKVVQRVPVKIGLPTRHPLAGYLRPGLSVMVSVDTRHAGAGLQAAGPTTFAESTPSR